MSKTVLLIQGIFWQRHETLGVACVPREGNVAVVNSGIMEFMFHGAVFASEGPGMAGGMVDNFGQSEISRFIMTSSYITFSKRYNDRTDVILYSFPTKYGNIWSGYYQGSKDIGRGVSRCVIIEVPEEFFNPSALLASPGW